MQEYNYSEYQQIYIYLIMNVVFLLIRHPLEFFIELIYEKYFLPMRGLRINGV